jgi:hypothetical protein
VALRLLLSIAANVESTEELPATVRIAKQAGSAGCRAATRHPLSPPGAGFLLHVRLRRRLAMLLL